MTNGDFVRSLTDEKLAEVLYETLGCDACPKNRAACDFECVPNIEEWLKQEVQEDAAD